MAPTIVRTEDGRAEDRDAILKPLIAYNLSKAQEPKPEMLGLLVKDDAGQTIGGLWARSVYEWLFVELLVVPETMRGTGLGTKLMKQAEEIARERGCTGIWLDTFEFQARPFYEKLGFSVFGELEDHPMGVSRYWLRKRL